MMHLVGNFTGASRTLNGDLVLYIAVDDDQKVLQDLYALKDESLSIDIDKVRKKRSLNANAYLWKLCDEIAKKLGNDKDTIYLLELSRYGVFTDMSVIRDAVPLLKREFRYTEVLDDYGEYHYVRCYLGSSHYNTKEMSDLIDGVVRDANDLGIDTWSKEEIDNLIKNWKGE